MSGSLLVQFFKRDIDKMITELNTFQHEDNLWRTTGSIRNSSGNLALHIIGGNSYLIGTLLAKTGYIRDRDLEFAQKGMAREELTNKLQTLAELIVNTIGPYTEDQMNAAFPIPFDGANNSNKYVLTQLLLHLNYHLGQINYLRRALETVPS